VTLEQLYLSRRAVTALGVVAEGCGDVVQALRKFSRFAGRALERLAAALWLVLSAVLAWSF